MDKVKIILDFSKKYLFWFIFVSTVVVVLICWWLSTASLAKSFQLQQLKIKKKFTEVDAIATDLQHPTPEFIKAVTDKHQKLKEGVLAVWMTLYEQQKQNNRWPEVLGPKVAQQLNESGPTDDIHGDVREKYQNVIKNYFPTLFKIIDLRQPPDSAETGGKTADNADAARTPRINPGALMRMAIGARSRTTPNADNSDWVGTVDWDEADRQHLENRFNWTTRPDSDIIRLRQEDIWVYEALLRVVSNTNSEDIVKKDDKGNELFERIYIKDHAQANVKRIEWIQIGPDAIKAWSDADQTVFKSPAAVVATTGRGGAAAPAAGRDTGESKEQLLKDRYVDDKGAPLEADAKHPYAEFKMMPISMKLHMDQRKISKLLVECVNSAMPIEVRRVRIRPGTGEILDPASAGTATATPTAPTRDSFRSARSSPTRSTGFGAATDEAEAGPYDISVEIQGIIYIYNQPDKNTLGTGEAGNKPTEPAAGAAPGTAAPGASPEAAPATPPATAPAK
jgi:hypothetical protein